MTTDKTEANSSIESQPAVGSQVDRRVSRRRGGCAKGYVRLQWTQQKERERERSERFPGWQRGTELRPGDEAETDYEGGVKRVRILSRTTANHCQSGVLFVVAPSLRGNEALTEYDAHWFRPVTANDSLSSAR